MSLAAAMLDRLDQLGVVATVEVKALRLRPASVIPADLLADLRRYKGEVLALLSAFANDPHPVLVGADVDASGEVQFPQSLTVPIEAAVLLAHVRDELRCRVTLEGERLTIQPAYRCPPRVLAAVLAVRAEVEALIAKETCGSWMFAKEPARRKDGGRR